MNKLVTQIREWADAPGRFTLSQEEVRRVLRNALIFLAPALLLILEALRSGASWQDVQYVIYTWLLSTMTDLLRKFLAENPSK